MHTNVHTNMYMLHKNPGKICNRRPVHTNPNYDLIRMNSMKEGTVQ